MSGSHNTENRSKETLFGPDKLSGLSRNGPQERYVTELKTDARETQIGGIPPASRGNLMIQGLRGTEGVWVAHTHHYLQFAVPPGDLVGPHKGRCGFVSFSCVRAVT